jgi:hypothetical protein
MTPQLGKFLVLLGLGIVLLGAFLWLGGGSLLGWFGRLPGDVRVERPGFRLYAPFVSMLLISLLLSLIMWLVRRFGS